MQITAMKAVTIDYRLTDEQGEELDSSEDQGPLTYIHGMNEIIAGLESALEGREAGDELQVQVAPENAYGERFEELCVEVDRDEFADFGELDLGMQFSLTNEEDVEHVVTIVAMDEETVVVDGNHPLAGIPLCFDVTVREVRDATEEEIVRSQLENQ